MSSNKKKKQCPYNEWVYCSETTCDYCGWNPAGRKMREAKPVKYRYQKNFGQKEEDSGRKKQINNTSGHTGVYWNKLRRKWTAEIRKNGQRIHLGCFSVLEDAIKARQDAEKQLMNTKM